MKPATPTDLGRDLVVFFEEYLPEQRGMSPHTIRSYRDTLLLLLQYLARTPQRPVEHLTVADLSAEVILTFLRHLETERHNSVATRNARLGHLHGFARFLAFHHPEQLGSLQRIIGLPFKRGATEAHIEYLDGDEMAALFQSIDRSSRQGRRDYTLFAVMFNTGARVQEVLDLRYRDVRLDTPPPSSLTSGNGSWGPTGR